MRARLQDPGGDNSRRQYVGRGAAPPPADNMSSVEECAPAACSASTIAANTGRFSTQLAWARTARRYNGEPCGSSPGKLFNSAFPARMSDHLYTPTPSIRIAIVHVANANTAQTGMLMFVLSADKVRWP